MAKGRALLTIRRVYGEQGHIRRVNTTKVESGWYNKLGKFVHKHYAKSWGTLVKKTLGVKK